MIDSIIFRIPADAYEWDTDAPVAGVTLVSIDIIDGEMARVGTPFAVFPEDSYSSLGWNQIVLAEATPEGSIEHSRLTCERPGMFAYSDSELREDVRKLLLTMARKGDSLH